MKIALLPISIVVVTFLCSTLSVAMAQAPSAVPIAQIPLRDQPIENIVEHFSYVNDIDPKIALSVMQCESKGIQSTVGDDGNARGIFQYWTDTWARHSKEMGETLDINSSYDQARLATWAIANGHADEWTTYVAIKRGGRYSFYSKSLKKSFTVYCSMMS